MREQCLSCKFWDQMIGTPFIEGSEGRTWIVNPNEKGVCFCLPESRVTKHDHACGLYKKTNDAGRTIKNNHKPNNCCVNDWLPKSGRVYEIW
jgi:hypothetical protein